jgi:hypothetical protein
VYFADGLRLADVPPAYQRLRCVTTRDADGDTNQGITFTLGEPSVVYALHDQGVKKTPDWLRAFAATADTVTAIDGGGRVSYQVFRRAFPAGVVALGTNTQARKLTRQLRQATGRSTFMYLVCVPLTAAAAAQSAAAGGS